MTKDLLTVIMILGFVSSVLSVPYGRIAHAGDMTEEMKRMQQQLNEQVISKPFDVADDAQVKAYIEDAQRRGVTPPPYTGTHWRPGYTCEDLRRYSFREYLACRHYYFHYGHYYR